MKSTPVLSLFSGFQQGHLTEASTDEAPKKHSEFTESLRLDIGKFISNLTCPGPFNCEMVSTLPSDCYPDDKIKEGLRVFMTVR